MILMGESAEFIISVDYITDPDSWLTGLSKRRRSVLLLSPVLILTYLLTYNLVACSETLSEVSKTGLSSYEAGNLKLQFLHRSRLLGWSSFR